MATSKLWTASALLICLILVIDLGIQLVTSTPVDEVIARAGNMKHGKNLGGRFKAKGRKVDNGKAELDEYDVAYPVPLPVEVDDKNRGQKPGGGQTRKQKKNRRNRRAATVTSATHWDNGKIPYAFHNLDSASQDAVLAVMDEIKRYSCVNWVPRTNEATYVKITGQTGTGCWSYVGKVPASYQPQTLSLDVTCIHRSVIMHELLHASGMIHEQSRADRDSFITVLTNNIDPDLLGNFAKHKDTSTFGISYDYYSVMHYGPFIFSSNGQPTMQTVDSQYQSVIGKAHTFSADDVKLLNKLYSCAAQCPPADCSAKGFQAHDCSCYCPSGDPNNPVVSCGEVCLEPDQQCTCEARAGACSGLSNSQCQSGACRCDSGYVSHNGKCVLTSAITCSAINEDCKCSLNANACSGLANTQCDTSTNACTCSPGYAKLNGECVLPSDYPCNTVGVSCLCSHKGSTACDSVPNSSCDTTTDSCKCNEDYHNAGDGSCTAAQDCTSPGMACNCDVQGGDACDLVPFSACNTATGACECVAGSNGDSSCIHGYTLDGSQISPFIQLPTSTASWTVKSGSDASSTTIPSNGYYLSTSGSSNDESLLELTIDSGPAGPWCVSLKGQFFNSQIYLWVRYPNGYWYTGMYCPAADCGPFYDLQLQTGSQYNYPLKVVIEGSMTNSAISSTYTLNIDAVTVVPC